MAALRLAWAFPLTNSKTRTVKVASPYVFFPRADTGGRETFLKGVRWDIYIYTWELKTD